MITTPLLLTLLSVGAPCPDCPPELPAMVAARAVSAEPPVARRGASPLHATRATVLWVKGDARLDYGPSDAAAPSGVSDAAWVGDQLAADTLLVVPDGGLVVLLLDGDQLAHLLGPALHHWSGAALTRRRGQGATREPLDGYREGPDTGLPPLRFLAPSAPSSDEVGLALTSPPPTLLRELSPVIRWRWSGADARFDLTLARLDGGEALTVIERWRGLAGRSLTLWAPLEPGARYRVTITLRGARPFARVLVDQVEFAPLDEAARRAVDGSLAALLAIQRQTDAVRPELEVLRARLLESHGLLADAERIWAALTLLHPDRLEPRHHARRLHAELHREPSR